MKACFGETIATVDRDRLAIDVHETPISETSTIRSITITVASEGALRRVPLTRVEALSLIASLQRAVACAKNDTPMYSIRIQESPGQLLRGYNLSETTEEDARDEVRRTVSDGFVGGLAWLLVDDDGGDARRLALYIRTASGTEELTP